MTENQRKIDRRKFLKSVGAAGLGSFLAVSGCKSKKREQAASTDKQTQPPKKTETPELPRRKLGNTGVEVPVLALGTMFDAVEKQVVLRRALELKVTYWDTAHGYTGGNSELGIGKFLSREPQARKDLFIASKASDAETPDQVEERLQESLKRMNTDYVDVYYLHGIDDPDFLRDEFGEWAKSAKERGLIKFFGFTTHDNITEMLNKAAGLDWVDVIMHSYNFRLMSDKQLNAAIDACYKAGKGLVAMKTMARGSVARQEDNELAQQLLKRGFTEGQVKLKVVLEDKRFASVCVGRDNLEHLALNVAAVHDKTALAREDVELLLQYAEATCDSYCAGCSKICNSAVPEAPYVNDIMRYLMYYNGYGEHQAAREEFAKIPADVRRKLLAVDYSAAESRCPQRMPIGKLVAEAVRKLA